MLLKIKTFGFQKNCTRYVKNIGDKIVHLKKIYKLASDHFLIEHVVLFLIIKNVIKNYLFSFIHQKRFYKNEKFNFLPKYTRYGKYVKKQTIKFGYFQTYPSLVWESKFYHTDLSLIMGSIIFAVSLQGSKIVFPARLSKKTFFLSDRIKIACMKVMSRFGNFSGKFFILLKLYFFKLSLGSINEKIQSK